MRTMFEFLQHFGVSALDAIWFPTILWTIAALLVFTLLSVLKNLNALYQYHLRVALIISLPLGLVSVFLVEFLSSLNDSAKGFDPILFVIESPLVTSTNASQINPFSTLNFLDVHFLLGTFTVIVCSVSCILLLKLVWNFRKLKKLKNSISLHSLSEFGNFRYEALKSIQIAFQDREQVPFTFGWKQPIIVLPNSIKGNFRKVEIAIQHELVHIKRSDYLIQLILATIESLLWFHPLIRFTNKEIEIYREISCDQTVLNSTDISMRHYASLLFELIPLRQGIKHFTIDMGASNSTLKQRIEIMKNHRTHKPSIKMSMLLFLITILGATIPMACTDLQAQSALPESDIKTINVDYTVQLPELIGGIKVLKSKINYPEEAKKAGIEGRVEVQFIVDEQGNVLNPLVINGIGFGCDKAALKAVSESKFKPGLKDGEPVKVQLSLPVLFKLDDSNTE